MSIVQSIQWITFAGLLFWLVFYWQAGWKIVVDIRNALKSGNSRMDTALLILMAIFTLIIILTAFLTLLGQVKFGFPRKLEDPVWRTAIGCALALAGIVGTFYCRHQLSQFWTAETALKKEHKVVDKGVYGIVRHPIYTFAIILYVGMGLVFPTWWNIICAAGVVLAYMLKAKDEETFLEKNLPGYTFYRKRVRYRLFPRIW